MTELRQAVTAIAGYVESESMDVPDELKSASAIYAAACRQVNNRLAEAARLLQAWQLSEAVRQVEIEPDALKQYAELAFKNHGRWLDITQKVGLTIPPKLNAEAARQVNEAYGVLGTINDLLRQHRTLALSRAPLRRRLEIVRLLRRKMPTNAAWQDDVKAYEEARFGEMRAALADPAARADFEDVSALNDELKADWLVPPPLELVDSAQKAFEAIILIEGEKHLNTINPLLLKAMNDGDLDEAERLLEAAEQAAIKFRVPTRAAILAPLREAAEWVPAERKERKTARQYEKAVDLLRSSLQDGLDWWYVQEYYRGVREFGRPIPRDAASLFAARVRRRRLVWGLGAAAVVLLAGGGVAAYFLK